MNNLVKNFALILIAICTLISPLQANITPTKGATLQVLATSGLKLRLEPRMDSPTIKVMPFGAEVTLLEFESNCEITRVEWVDGKWMKVNYNGHIGWAFDGFLTILNVPNHTLEKCYEDLDLAYPLQYWTRANFETQSIDTLSDEQTYLRTYYHLINNQSLDIIDRDVTSTLQLHLKDVRVMEVYQLLESMIVPKTAKNLFKESSIFIEKDGTIKHIKIDVQGGIDIRESYDGTIRVIIHTYTGC